MIINRNHKEFLVGLLGKNHNMGDIMRMFNEHFETTLTTSAFRKVCVALDILFKRDNKSVKVEDLGTNSEEILQFTKELLSDGMMDNLTKPEIYNLVNEKFPCFYTRFCNITKEVNWKSRRGFKVELDIEF